jgi:6,7-dimethyl-8-ribityllumazine synthase
VSTTQGPFPPEQNSPSPSVRPWPGEMPRPDVAAPPEPAVGPGPPAEAELVPPAPGPAAVGPAPPLHEEASSPEPEPAPMAVAPAAVSGEHAQGELQIPHGYRVLEGGPAGTARTVGVVVSRFNSAITSELLKGALAELERLGVRPDAVTVMPVPGAFELPLAAMALAKSRRYACVVALGCVIRGETPHFDYVAGEAASGLQLAALETGIPVAFGVLTVDTVEQARARLDRGAEAVRTALELADVFAKLRAIAKSAG